MKLKVSRKVTVPPVSGVAPAVTTAVISNTDPLAAVEGVTESVVVVVVCAVATPYDITMNKAAYKEARELLHSGDLPCSFVFLDLPKTLPALPEACVNAMALEFGIRKHGCDSTYLAAAMRSQREFHVVLADDADWQERNDDVALRGTSMNSGISKPFNWCSELVSVFWERGFRVMQDREVVSTRASGVCVTQ
jgi:hypothetical protein